MKKQAKVILIVAVAIVVLIGFGSILFRMPLPNREKWVYVEEEVKRGPLTVVVTERGKLDYYISAVEYDLDLYRLEEQEEGIAEVPLDTCLQIAEVFVAPGQQVEQGTPLLSFTKDSLEEVRVVLVAAVTDAKLMCWEAQQEYDRVASLLKAEYDSTNIISKYAEDIYRDTAQAVDDEITSMDKEISRRQDMTTFFEEKLSEAQEKYEEAKKTYQTAKVAYTSAGTKNVPNYLVLSNEYQAAKTAYYNAQSGLEQAKENLADNKEQIEQLKVLLEDAKERVAIDKLNNKAVYDAYTTTGENAQVFYDVASAEQARILEAQNLRLEELEKQLAAFDSFVGEEGILYAKEEGIVLEVIARKGDMLSAAEELLTYTTPEKLKVEVTVKQEDVAAIQTGDAVPLRFEAHSGRFFGGVVQNVHSTATVESDGEVRYPVIISVNEDSGTLYRGMNAEAIFVKERKENALYLSERAVVQEDGTDYVYVRTVSGDYVLQEVETGICGEEGVEILSGLEEGALVYILMTEEEAAAWEETRLTENATAEEAQKEEQDASLPESEISSADGVSDNEMWGPAVSGGNISGGDVSGGDMMPGKEEKPWKN